MTKRGNVFKLIGYFLVAWMLSAISACRSSGALVLTSNERVLEDGSSISEYVLDNGLLRVAVLPDLGGKISSIRDAVGNEYLSRSSRAYVRRRFGMKYGETEFDGIDECFPTMVACRYPVSPWDAVEIPDHGDICQLAWRVLPDSADEALRLAVDGPHLPYRFTRAVRLDGRAVVLSYLVENLSSEEPFHFYYAFHPLFAAETGCRMEIPEEMPITVSWSTGAFLGKVGIEKLWRELRDENGEPFRDSMFTTGRKRYYKFYSDFLAHGEAAFYWPDGRRVELFWPVELFPRYAVWCSEGGVDGLEHFAIEPTTGIVEDLSRAFRDGSSFLTIKPGGSLRWEIRMFFTDSSR